MIRDLTELWLPLFVGCFRRRITNEDHVICEALQLTAGSIMETPILGREEQRIAWFREAYWDALAQSDGQEIPMVNTTAVDTEAQGG